METMLTTGSIDRFLMSLSARGRAKNTIRARGADLRKFFEFAGDHPTDEFEEKALAFLNHEREAQSARTMQRYLGTLRNFGRWAGLHDPVADYLTPKPAKPSPHPVKEGVTGLAAMLNAANKVDHKNLVALCGFAGLRVNEAVTVTVSDVNIIERTLHVRGKGDRARVVPLTDFVLRVLAHRIANPHPDGRLVALHERAARKVITRLGERVGCSQAVSSHDLRATFATEAYDRSKDLRAVQELLGHADSRTTQVYTGISEKAMRDAAEIAPAEEGVA